MALLCKQFAYHDDNYGFLLHDEASGLTAAIDLGCAKSYRDALAQAGWQLTHIFITHHHWDHTDGLAEIKQQKGAHVIGPHNTKDFLAALIDTAVGQGDVVRLGAHHFDVIATPGHTLDMVNYYSAANQMLFSGDSLFVLGCGRLFEGDGPMMWQSLAKLIALPDETVIYSAHEYALSNAEFAATIDPHNEALLKRIANIRGTREAGRASVPSTLAEECATNPFLRADDKAIRAHLGLHDASDEAVFTEIRARKDRF